MYSDTHPLFSFMDEEPPLLSPFKESEVEWPELNLCSFGSSTEEFTLLDPIMTSMLSDAQMNSQPVKGDKDGQN